MLWITLSLLLVFAVMLVIALRGRRVDDHPLCARCRFDLIGVPEPKVCSECGADLQAPRGRWVRRRPLVYGNRRRRRHLLHVSALCVLVLVWQAS